MVILIYIIIYINIKYIILILNLFQNTIWTFEPLNPAATHIWNIDPTFEQEHLGKLSQMQILEILPNGVDEVPIVLP